VFTELHPDCIEGALRIPEGNSSCYLIWTSDYYVLIWMWISFLTGKYKVSLVNSEPGAATQAI
jgi:hypothetical protein